MWEAFAPTWTRQVGANVLCGGGGAVRAGRPDEV